MPQFRLLRGWEVRNETTVCDLRYRIEPVFGGCEHECGVCGAVRCCAVPCCAVLCRAVRNKIFSFLKVGLVRVKKLHRSKISTIRS